MKIKIIVLSILLLLMVSYQLIFNLKEDNRTDLYAIENYMEYEEFYMGNASNLVGLFNELPLSENGLTVELFSENYGVQVNYVVLDDIDHLKEHLVFNSTVVFALIDNLDEITFNFEDHYYIVERQNVEAWYDVLLSELLDQKHWQEHVVSRLNSDEFIESLSGLIKIVR